MNIDVHTPKTLRDEGEQKKIAALNLDAIVVVAYGLILPQVILDAPRFGCLNIHFSLLPRWRRQATRWLPFILSRQNLPGAASTPKNRQFIARQRR